MKIYSTADMPRPKKTPSPDVMIRSIYLTLNQIKNNTIPSRETIVLSKAQAKKIFGALHTVTLYLHQPANVRALQIERIIVVRDDLEKEFEVQTGQKIEE